MAEQAVRGRQLLVSGLAVLALLAAAGCGGRSAAVGDDAAPALQAGLTHEPYPVDATALEGTDGAPYSLADSTDKDLSLVFFGYTHCPDICGLVMSSLASAMTRLDPADRDRVDVIFVTTDPARDTGPVLRRYLDRYDPSFLGLTGDLDTIAAIALPLAVYVEQGDPLPSGGRDLQAHSSQITAITGDDTSPVLWTEDTSAAEFAGDIHALLNGGLDDGALAPALAANGVD